MLFSKGCKGLKYCACVHRRSSIYDILVTFSHTFSHACNVWTHLFNTPVIFSHTLYRHQKGLFVHLLEKSNMWYTYEKADNQHKVRSRRTGLSCCPLARATSRPSSNGRFYTLLSQSTIIPYNLYYNEYISMKSECFCRLFTYYFFLQSNIEWFFIRLALLRSSSIIMIRLVTAVFFRETSFKNTAAPTGSFARFHSLTHPRIHSLAELAPELIIQKYRIANRILWSKIPRRCLIWTKLGTGGFSRFLWWIWSRNIQIPNNLFKMAKKILSKFVVRYKAIKIAWLQNLPRSKFYPNHVTFCILVHLIAFTILNFWMLRLNS